MDIALLIIILIGTTTLFIEGLKAERLCCKYRKMYFDLVKKTIKGDNDNDETNTRI